MSRRLHRRARGDDGLTLVLMSLVLVVLMVFGAFAIDLGMLMNERRQDQGAADAAATSGAVLALVGGDLQDVIDEVLAKADFDVGRTIDVADWLDCEDTGQRHHTAKELAAVTPGGLSPATECISWSEGFFEMRVRLPDQVIGTSFAKVIGIDTLATRAVAEIEFVPLLEGGAALPFVALSSAATGQHVCIRTSSSDNPPTQMVGNGPGAAATVGTNATPGNPNDADPCDGLVYDPGSSTFGTLTPRDYDGGCDTQNANVLEAIMQGADHPMGFFADPIFTIPPGGTSSAAQTARQASGDVRVDGPGPGCTTFMPNTIKMNSGLTSGDLRCALISANNTDVCSANGDPNMVPRLKQSSTVEPDVFVGETMDNTPAWAYFSTSSNLPASCVALRSAHGSNDPTWDFYDRREAFMDCLDDWNGNTHDELFTEAIGGSPRLGYVPQIAERRLCDAQDSPAGCTPTLDFAHVNSYLPIFLNKVYAKQGNNQAGCEPLDPRLHAWYMHEAGQDYGANCGPNNANIDRLSAFVLDCKMLPRTVCNPDLLPGIPANQGSTTSLVDMRLLR